MGLFLALLFLFCTDLSKQSEQSYTAVITPSVVFHHEAVDNHFPRKITLKFSYLFSLTENHLNLVLSRDLIKLSSVVVFSLDGEQSYEQNPPQCFYHVSPESFSISGFHKNSHPQYEFGQFSLCERGAEGFVRVPPNLNFPHGAEFRLEPVNSQSAIENHTIDSLRIALQSPHYLLIVPYSNHVKSSRDVAEDFRQNHDGSRAKPLPTKLQFNFSADSVWNVHEYADMHGLRETAKSFVRHRKSDKLTRHPRAAPILEDTTNRTLMLDPVRVVHRPNQSVPFILELYLIVDETLTAAFREPYDTLLYRVHRLISEVNALFAPFNVVIVVVRLEIWKRDRVQLNVDEHHLLPTLAQFKRIHADVRHDCLHALLGIKDGGSRTRGKANSRTMCVFSRCVAYTRDAPTIDLTDTVHTMAHELGHNFGLRHDTEECNCQNCIMATGVEFGNHLMRWSPCSMRDLPVLLDYGMGLCLYDTPQLDAAPVISGSSPRLPARFSSTPVVRTNSAALVPSVVRVYDWNFQASHISTARVLAANPTTASSLCGNGILDPGEECDCGNRTSCPVQLQDCCDVRRCLLRAGSTCASGPCCHVDVNPTSGRFHCQLAKAGTVCRKESGDCDLPEYCDGKSQWCPMDVYKADGIGCVTEIGTQAFCVRGGCREADQWCRVLWGKTGRRAHPHCFYENHVLHQSGAPDSVANCGKIRPFAIDRWEDAKSWPGLACPSWQDAECGRLWCHHRNEKAMLLGWLESQTRFLSTVGESCSALVYDPVWPASDPTTWNVLQRRQMNVNIAGEGLRGAITQDAGMVPDGTPCSRGLCYNGSCISLTELPSRLQCRCNGLGVCNNLGNCHCNLGFHPPNCDYGGDGGSIDSGPAPSGLYTDPGLVIALTVLSLVVLPLIAFALYCFFCHGYKCTPLILDPVIPTKSGLRKPFDRGLRPLFRNWCRRTRAPLFTAANHIPAVTESKPDGPYLPQSGKTVPKWTNGYLVDQEYQNGFSIASPVLVNGSNTSQYKHGYSKIHNLSSSNHLSTTHSNPKSPKLTPPRLLPKPDHIRFVPHEESDNLGCFLSPANNKYNTQAMSSLKLLDGRNHEANEQPTHRAKTKVERLRERFLHKSGISKIILEPTGVKHPTTKVANTHLSNRVAFSSTTDADKLEESCSNSTTNESVILAENPKTCLSSIIISEPRLETTTYIGNTCSLPEAVHTLKRSVKPPSKLNPEIPQTGKRKRIIHRFAGPRPVNPTPLVNERLAIGRSTSQRNQFTRGLEISQPRLENTTYNESLHDLRTAQMHIQNSVCRGPSNS